MDQNPGAASRAAELRASWNSRFVQQPWGRMRVRQAGRGPFLVAVHGLGGSGKYWEDLAWQAPSYTVVAPDLGGFGESSKPDATYDFDFHVASLDALIQALPSKEPISLVGHSVGGVVAAGWAAGHPAQVSSLALVATPYPGLHRLPPPVRWVKDAPYSWRRRLPVNVARSALYPLLVPAAFFRGQRISNVRDFTRQSLAARTRTAWSLIEDVGTAPSLESLRQLPTRASTLILIGVPDRLATEGDRGAWSSLLPTADRLSHRGGHQVLLHGGGVVLGEWLESHAPNALVGR